MGNPILSVNILYMSGRTYNLNSTLNYRFLRNFHANFIYSQNVLLPEIWWEEVTKEFFLISFSWRCFICPVSSRLISNRILRTFIIDNDRFVETTSTKLFVMDDLGLE